MAPSLELSGTFYLWTLSLQISDILLLSPLPLLVTPCLSVIFSLVWSEAQLKVNPFPAKIPILHPLKTPENQRFSGVFRGYKMGTLAGNGLKKNMRENYACSLPSSRNTSWKRTISKKSVFACLVFCVGNMHSSWALWLRLLFRYIFF